MGPNCEVPEIKAGGAVPEPLPSISILTLGVFLGEVFGPERHDVVEGVGAHGLEASLIRRKPFL